MLILLVGLFAVAAAVTVATLALPSHRIASHRAEPAKQISQFFDAFFTLGRIRLLFLHLIGLACVNCLYMFLFI